VVIDNSSGDELYIRWNNIRIRANTFDNFYVASELFMEGLYNMNCDSANIVVCDVGMNVGVASLVFANMKNVQKVYSFEPFRPTYESALMNFDLNPQVKQKIVPFNLGAGGNNSELEIPVGDVDSAAMSTTDFVIQQVAAGAVRKVKVQIRDIKEIVAEMQQQHPGAQILLKLDCEGAEYEIMEQLNTSGLLKDIRYIVIEWHMRGSRPLEKILEANGFCNVVFPRPTQQLPDMGMIYAFNTKERNN
jgi:FkbM family methyltransferase